MERAGTLEITTYIGCKCNCVYCPQNMLISKYYGRQFDDNPNRMMTLDDFKKCVDKLPVETRIDFSGMAEPWLNTDCTKMLLYANEKGFPIAVYSTLVGMKMNDFDLIKDIDFEEFVVHIPDEERNSSINITEEYSKLLRVVMKYCQADGKRLVTGISCHGTVHHDIAKMVPKDSKMITELHDRAGNVKSEYVDSKINAGQIICINCSADMHHNVLLPDGTVLLCCMDYGMKHILGNLLTQTYEEIRQSPEIQKIRDGLKNDSFDILCRNCINARDIYELYDEYFLYKKWTNNLLVTQETSNKEFSVYKNWIRNLKKTNRKLEKELENYEKNYNERLNELRDYKEWVDNLLQHNQ